MNCAHPIGYRAIREGLATICTLCGADAPPLSAEDTVSNSCHDGTHRRCQGRHGPLALRHLIGCACSCHGEAGEETLAG
jgi:hypothetical protein